MRMYREIYSVPVKKKGGGERLFTSRRSKAIRDQYLYKKGYEDGNRILSDGPIRKELLDIDRKWFESAREASSALPTEGPGFENLEYYKDREAARNQRHLKRKARDFGEYTQTRGQKKVRGQKPNPQEITSSYLESRKQEISRRLGGKKSAEAKIRAIKKEVNKEMGLDPKKTPEVKITEPRPNVSAEVIPTTSKPQTPTIVHTEPKPVVKPNPELTNNFTNTKKPTSKFSFKRLTEKFKSNGRSIFGRMNKGDIKNFLKSKLKRLIRR